MKEFIMKQTFFAIFIALAANTLIAQQKLPDLQPKQSLQLRELIGNALTAKPTQPRKLLVFFRCEGFCHGESIVVGNEALRIAAEQTGAFQVDFSRDYQALTAENLKRYDALVLNNTTHLKLKDKPAISPALRSFVESGKGLAVIHAGSDNFFNEPELAAMVGGLFDGHPWHGGGTWAFHLEETDHPITIPFGGKDFKFSDEIYQQSSPAYDRTKMRVLISLDMKDPATAQRKGQKRADKDFAVAWVRPYGKGRVFFTSFAHDRRAWLYRPTLLHILNGIQYTLGDLPAKDQPR